MNVLDLYHHGIIEYLFDKGLLSGSTLSYIEYCMRYQELRNSNKGYRESVRILSHEFGVSETTIKKAIRILQN